MNKRIENLNQYILLKKDREVTYKQFSIDAAEFSKSDAEATLDVREATEGYNTIYQLKSLGATEYPHIYWTENLKGGIEYQLSCYVKAATATEASLRYAHTVLPEIAGTQTFDLNKGEILNDVIIGKITPLATDWKKITIRFFVEEDGRFLLQLAPKTNSFNTDYIYFYNFQLEAPGSTIGQLRLMDEGVDIEKKKSLVVKSSYEGLYYLLIDVESAIINLEKSIATDNLNAPAVHSRMVLLSTYVKELRDGVANNQHISKKEILSELKKIETAYNQMIIQMNSLVNDNIDQYLKEIGEPVIDSADGSKPIKNPLYEEN